MAFKKEHSYRVKAALEALKIQDALIVKATGLSKSTISHIMTEAQDASIDALTKIVASYPNINANYILTGDGSMFIDSIESNEDSDSEIINKENQDLILELQRELKEAYEEIGRLNMELNKKVRRN